MSSGDVIENVIGQLLEFIQDNVTDHSILTINEFVPELDDDSVIFCGVPEIQEFADFLQMVLFTELLGYSKVNVYKTADSFTIITDKHHFHIGDKT